MSQQQLPNKRKKGLGNYMGNLFDETSKPPAIHQLLGSSKNNPHPSSDSTKAYWTKPCEQTLEQLSHELNDEAHDFNGAIDSFITTYHTEVPASLNALIDNSSSYHTCSDAPLEKTLKGLIDKL